MTAIRPSSARLDAPADTRMLLLLHRALRCDLERLVAALDDIDVGDRRRARSLHRWYRELARQIHGHHRAEDEVFFPALAARSEHVAANVATQLGDDHRYVASLTDRVAERLRQLAGGGEVWREARQAARGEAAALSSLVADHFTHEEREVVPLFERHFTDTEFRALGRRADRIHSPVDLCFALPWFFDHLEPEERHDICADTPTPFRLLAAAFRPRYRRLVAAAGLPPRASAR